MDVRRDAPSRARKSRLLARWGAPMLLGLGLVACAGSQTAPETPATKIPALPPLPTTTLGVMPTDVDMLLEVDVDKLRSSEVWASVREVVAGSCVDTPDVQRLLSGTDSVVLAKPESARDGILAVSGDPAMVNWRSLFEMARNWAQSSNYPAALVGSGVAEGRLEGLRLDLQVEGQTREGAVLAEVSPGLVVTATHERLRSLAAAYDVPGRTPPAAPDDLATDGGTLRGFLVASGILDAVWPRIPSDIAEPLRGLAMAYSINTEADGVHLHLRARLGSSQAVTQLMQAVSQRLRSAALVLRLMGLPSMDQRLIGAQEGSVVDYRLHLTWKEAGRLLKLAEMEAKNRLLKACDVAAQRAADAAAAAGAQP